MKILVLNPPFLKRFSRPHKSPAVTKSGTIYFPIWLAYCAGVEFGIREMAETGKSIQNVVLKNQDVLYVPPKTIVSVERFMLRLSNILRTLIDIERGIIMSQDVWKMLNGQPVRGAIVY